MSAVNLLPLPILLPASLFTTIIIIPTRPPTTPHKPLPRARMPAAPRLLAARDEVVELTLDGVFAEGGGALAPVAGAQVAGGLFAGGGFGHAGFLWVLRSARGFRLGVGRMG